LKWPDVDGHPYWLLEPKHEERDTTVIISRVKAINLFFIMQMVFGKTV
jgi:hypothetical protein